MGVETFDYIAQEIYNLSKARRQGFLPLWSRENRGGWISEYSRIERKSNRVVRVALFDPGNGLLVEISGDIYKKTGYYSIEPCIFHYDLEAVTNLGRALTRTTHEICKVGIKGLPVIPHPR